MKEIERKTHAILHIIANSAKPIGSKEISAELKAHGIELTERAIRYHLKIMDEKGLTETKWKEGRTITLMGREELEDALVSDKVGFIISKIESMAYQMDFDLDKKAGKVILNVSLIPKDKFAEALGVMKKVFDKKLSMGVLVAVAHEGEALGDLIVPEDKVAFGTICSINLNGILLRYAISVESKFGGMLQIDNYHALRFTDLISYSGSTLDPLEVFIKSKMTSVGLAAATGSGKIMASFREIPALAREAALPILRRAEDAGFGSALVVGKPGHPLLGVPVAMGRVGFVVPGGLNPVAVLEEEGIATESKALVTLIDYQRLKLFCDVRGGS
ncbi:MAG: NrpR regulatory domain-containing protein [bacterium]